MAHKGLWDELDKLNGQETAGRAKCDYESEMGRYIISLLDKKYAVQCASRQILVVGLQKDAGFLEQLCILSYLINAKDIPLANKIVAATALEGGEFFFRGPHCLPTDKLAKAFGQHPQRLYETTVQFNAKRAGFGDASIELMVLPRVPVVFVIWAGDDEFPARASVLFDPTATAQLPLDGLWTAVNLAVNAVTGS